MQALDFPSYLNYPSGLYYGIVFETRKYLGKPCFFPCSGWKDRSLEAFLWNFPTTYFSIWTYLTAVPPFQCNYGPVTIIHWWFIQAHTEVVLDGLNVGLVFVPPGTVVKLLFRAVVVAASRLYKLMQGNLLKLWISLDSSVLFQISCLTFSAQWRLCLYLVSYHCWSNL